MSMTDTQNTVSLLRDDERDALADLKRAVTGGAAGEWLLGFIRQYPLALVGIASESGTMASVGSFLSTPEGKAAKKAIYQNGFTKGYQRGRDNQDYINNPVETNYLNALEKYDAIVGDNWEPSEDEEHYISSISALVSSADKEYVMHYVEALLDEQFELAHELKRIRAELATYKCSIT